MFFMLVGFGSALTMNLSFWTVNDDRAWGLGIEFYSRASLENPTAEAC